ncbi:gibberellin 3-beta-dioxygenase 1-like [Cucumis melo var. makuwa]|uniref:gibberellin 3beta-dioxygenase n=1 Tax=Cucumis melo var. makuwa TaxID=1194695 RepID=A0A5A7VCQ3_CUCMM|nr:gibberellin 3-beta-dioxygenase 1-like [Cucumis melo var. makuwa]
MTTLSQTYRDHPLIHHHHIVPLDFDSLRTIPDSHDWLHSSPEIPSSSSSCYHTNVDVSIPLIDLTDHDAIALIGNACETWGVFQLINHDVPMSLIEKAEGETRRLFDLPMTRKLKALRTPRDVTGYGLPRITPFFSKYMWHEGFTIMGPPIDHASQLWPSNYQPFCDVMEEYQRKMKALAEQITNLIFNYLKISDGANWLHSTGAAAACSTALQLNCYPRCPDPTRVMGLAPHTDTFLLTILHQTRTCGLQIFRDGSGWVPVAPLPGALVLNVGDLFHILSNGRFPNVLHRVVVDPTQRRLSMAYFYGPPPDFCVSPLNDPPETPCYRPVVVKDYVRLKAKNLENALSMIRL